jgi:hypothetical protein
MQLQTAFYSHDIYKETLEAAAAAWIMDLYELKESSNHMIDNQNWIC